ncbi:MAG: hypothetical protein JWM36_2105 [Hyphomicrobiales bacterium]|nr:hypothetical protein [Hyphomicrobiales bacterium]
MPGNKTHEQQIRTFERKDDVPKQGEYPTHVSNAEIAERAAKSAASRETSDEAGISTGHRADDQESRDHNTHNHGGQDGHGPQKHNRAEEKHGG